MDLIKRESIVSVPTIINRFDSIYNACELADIPYTSLDNSSYFCKYILTFCNSIIGSNYQLEYTFDWLINPETKKHLYIDIYYPDYNLAIEVDGEQHDKYCSKFYKSQKDFNHRKYLDKLKNKLLSNHNVSLVRIKASDSKQQIINKLSSCIISDG